MDKVLKVIRLIENQLKPFNIDWLKEENRKEDPYKVLVSCVLSLRTKDSVTEEATKRLFNKVNSPFKMVKLSTQQIEKLIYPVGFYRQKAKYIKELSKKIIKDFKGKVPSNLEDLLKLKGVGLKTANLVLGRSFGIPAICVDTHVHRIANRIGWVKTKSPKETEEKLKNIIPKNYWIRINSLLVAFGQRICLPASPFCSRCFVSKFCKKVGVKRSR